MIKVRIVIPAYNEAGRLPSTIKAMKKYLDSQEYIDADILMVNDGSTDKTRKVMEYLSMQYEKVHYISYDKNKGKGHAVKIGMLVSNGEYEWYIFSDADGSSDLRYIVPNLVDSVEPIVITNRELEDSKISDTSLLRFLSSRMYFFIKLILLGNKISDTQNGLKAYHRSVCHFLFKRQLINGFSFDVEILYIAQLNDIMVNEVPVVWLNTADSRVRLFRDSWRMFKELLLIRKNKVRYLTEDTEIDDESILQ